ncbi:MAG: methionine adenosyltransferase [Candidatus Izemoplasmatales bacterium]|jgi:S-adenosylmethionine synthetase|nr:methionine adenosyltransferase [Candidatus Izemoplasmatales bacterium]MDD4355379.1 methionine adenosyltransferase [Candidatus Izemoplasmatales bacterium]MDD4988331.1 methionine adenosyltransferase [Candidatus Izemoplasmatales bacterium]MDY0372916.1 methionine adenosyltransferase [Candidatus Izemoplasmatales bacterium]NLF48024.1 methionine adenosyltransferase [Acholeplasmataceae bacterium]
MYRFFTSESVTEGHPDKICDQISDAILDAILTDDPNARVACETLVTTGLVLVAGEITTSTYVDIQKIVRECVADIGYTRGKYGFDADNLAVLVSINSQSPDIALGVNENKNHEQGAGDQGMMFGYATNETFEYMPVSHVFANRLARRLAQVRKEKILSYLRPDGKTQVTGEFNDDGSLRRIDKILISTQHAPNVTQETIREDLIKQVIYPVIPSELMDDATTILINPTGRFVIGGPLGDSGMTGRKIIVDTYGGAAHHGGGAFSGKDPSKVDRSAAYMCRYVAKNLVAAGIASQIEVQVSYAIGIAKPTSIGVDTFGTGKLPDDEIVKLIESHFDLRPKAIIDYFDLKRPIYRQVATYGHFGRNDLELPWEKLDQVEVLKKALSRG